MKYTENGKSYDVGPSGGYVDISSLDLLLKIVGLLVIFLTLFKNVFYSCDQRFFTSMVGNIAVIVAFFMTISSFLLVHFSLVGP